MLGQPNTTIDKFAAQGHVTTRDLESALGRAARRYSPTNRLRFLDGLFGQMPVVESVESIPRDSRVPALSTGHVSLEYARHRCGQQPIFVQLSVIWKD
jgi:hypothetical protein